jgi:hypothetical protein
MRQVPERFHDLVADTTTPWRYQAFFADGSYLCTNRQGTGLYRVAPGTRCAEWYRAAQFHADSLLHFRLQLWRVLSAPRGRRVQQGTVGAGCGVCARACHDAE